MATLPILRTTENAFQALCLTASISNSFDVEVLTGINNLDKTAPAIICYAESATEDFPNSGIHHVRTNVAIKEMAADSSTSSSLATTIFQTLMNANTKAALNSYPGYFVYEYFIENTSDGWDGDAWHQTYTFDVISALSGSL